MTKSIFIFFSGPRMSERMRLKMGGLDLCLGSMVDFWYA